MGTRPAKLAIRTDRDAGKSKECPSCQSTKMLVVKFVRSNKPSGMFWFCEKCNYEMPTR